VQLAITDLNTADMLKKEEGNRAFEPILQILFYLRTPVFVAYRNTNCCEVVVSQIIASPPRFREALLVECH